MPDFTVQIVGGAQVPWIDAKSLSPEAASRVMSDPDHLRSYRRFIPSVIPPVPATVTVRAIVGGVVAPLDAALGGRLFTASWVEWSGDYAPLLAHPAGQSSITTSAIDDAHVGHFVLRILRAGGGAWLLPFDVEIVT